MALREADDEGAQLTALHELCETLAISTEESLSVFPVDQLIPILVPSVCHAPRLVTEQTDVMVWNLNVFACMQFHLVH